MKFYNGLIFFFFLITQVPLFASGTYTSGGKSSTTNEGKSSKIKTNLIKKARDKLRKKAEIKKKKHANENSFQLGQGPGVLKKDSFDHSHSLWNELLMKFVAMNKKRTASTFNYKKVDKIKLNQYIEGLLKVKQAFLKSWKKNEQLAFYFNLYNALTVKRIVDSAPVKSIKDLGSGFPLFKSPWRVEFFTLFNKKSHLDYIEHTLVRESGDFNEPRVHFAFNCASIGCPALLDRAFTAPQLDLQLENAMINFLKDRTRHYYDEKKKELNVSAIFKWYGDDFSKGHRGLTSLRQFFAKYSHHITHKKISHLILGKKIDIEYLDYDWNLNNYKEK